MAKLSHLIGSPHSYICYVIEARTHHPKSPWTVLCSVKLPFLYTQGVKLLNGGLNRQHNYILLSCQARIFCAWSSWFSALINGFREFRKCSCRDWKPACGIKRKCWRLTVSMFWSKPYGGSLNLKLLLEVATKLELFSSFATSLSMWKVQMGLITGASVIDVALGTDLGTDWLTDK